MNWSRSCKAAALSASACLLMSCASLTKVEPVAYPPLDPALAKACPPLPPLPDGKVGTIARALVNDADQYRACADRHRRLVQAAELRRALKEIEDDDE